MTRFWVWGCALLLACCAGERSARAEDPRLTYPRTSPLQLAAEVRALDPSADAPAAVRTVDGTGVGLSILLPGLGQLRQGHRTRGTVFLAIEAALWTTVAISEVQSHLRTDHAHEHARVFASVADGVHSDQFYRDVSRYRSSDDYNIQVRRDARNTFAGPDSLLPQYVDAYEQANGYFGEDTWRWESFARFTEYSDLRTAASDARRRAAFAIGGALANRLFAVMDATRGRGRPAASSSSFAPPLRLEVTAGPGGSTTCAITKRF